jgi:hypothetical protein
MSDWMNGPHHMQRTAPLDAEPDPVEPVELTDPVDVVAWLRALPFGAVLRDGAGDAWQLNEFEGEPDSVLAWLCVGDDHRFWLSSATDMATMAAWRPFTVLYLPPGGAS